MKKIYLLVAILAIGFGASAQMNRRTPTLGFGLQVVQPLGQFGAVYDGYPVGLAGTFTAPVGRSPLELGVGFAWNSMGSQSEDIAVFIGTDDQGDDIYEEGTMRINSNNYRYQAIARFRPFTGSIQPYVDGLAGLETFSTKTDIEIDNSGYTEVSESNIEQRDFTASYGWAAGLRIRLTEGIFVEGRFERMEGGLAKYIDSETIEVDKSDNSLTYEVRESQTDKVTYTLGITFQF